MLIFNGSRDNAKRDYAYQLRWGSDTHENMG